MFARIRLFTGAWILLSLPIAAILLASLLALTFVPSDRVFSQTESPSRRQPNILFILTDDLDLDEIAYMPRLKKLLTDQGTSFSNYFVSVSLCCPSRTTTLRGQYSHNTQVKTNGGTNGGFRTAYALGVEKSTVATWLQAGGYRTALLGKYLNGYPNSAPNMYIPPGWDEWASAVRGNPYSEYRYTLNENGKAVYYGEKPEDYGTDVYARKAADFMKRAATDQKPFFVYFSVYAPHGPATPAPRHQNLFPEAAAPRTPAYNETDVSDKPEYVRNRPLLRKPVQERIDAHFRLRLQSLQAVDEAIENLYNTLKSINQLDNTYIVFTSDNGFHLGQHRLPSGKQTAYEEDIHLPLIVRGPNVPQGQIASQLAGNIDLAPTFADWAGAKAPEFVDGRSLAPLLRSKPPAPGAWRQAYLVEHWLASNQPQRNDTMTEPLDQDQGLEKQNARRTAQQQRQQRRQNPAGGDGIPEFHGLRTYNHTYVEYITGERELYDLKNDPAQLNNLAETARALLLREYAERLAKLKNCRAAECRREEDRPLSP